MDEWKTEHVHPSRFRGYPILLRMGFVVSVLLFLLVVPLSAQDGGPPATSDGSSILFLPAIRSPGRFVAYASNPLTVTLGIDSGRAVIGTIPTSGGVLRAMGADGSVFTLTLPSDALLFTTTITMTPVISVAGLPDGGALVAAVQLEPVGLRLFHPARLEIAPASPVARRELWPVLVRDDGAAHLFPADANAAGLVLRLHHFSAPGIIHYVGNDIYLAPEKYPPADLEAQFQAQSAALTEAYIRGEYTTLQHWSTARELARSYFVQVLQPLLNRAETDCKYADENLWKAFAWARQGQLLGFGFADEEAQIRQSEERAARHCWRELTKECLNAFDTERIVQLLSLARRAQLLGWAVGAEFDFFGLGFCPLSLQYSVRADYSADYIKDNAHIRGIASSRQWTLISGEVGELFEHTANDPLPQGSYYLTTTNRISLSGMADFTINRADGTASSETTHRVDINGAGISHNPSKAGDAEALCPPEDCPRIQPQGGFWQQWPWPDSPGQITYKSHNNAPVYELNVGMSQIRPVFTSRFRTVGNCPGGSGESILDEQYDNDTLKTKLYQTSCGEAVDDREVIAKAPYLAGHILLDRAQASAEVGPGWYPWIGGVNDLEEQVIDGSYTKEWPHCFRDIVYDPLDMLMASRMVDYFFEGGEPVPGVTCNVSFRVEWRIETPAFPPLPQEPEQPEEPWPPYPRR